MMYKKRGQATIFMILAIIILIVGIIYFSAQRASLEEIKFVKPEIVPVKNFIETCINDVAKQGIIILGQNGGYINFLDEVNQNPRSFMQLGPVDNIKTPYWWYDGVESIPTEAFIVNQLQDYITSELDSCIDDFSTFGSQFDVNKLGDLRVKVTLNEKDVTIDVNYPLELVNKLNSTIINLEKFKETIPIRLKKVYETAKDILVAENRDLFLEKKTIDLITLDEDIPTTDLSVSCSEKVWVIEDIQRKLKRLLNVNLPYINVVDSDFNEDQFVSNPFGEDTYKDSYYNSHYRWKISEKDYENLAISFDYQENWPFQFHVRPSNNGLLKSNSQKNQDYLDFFCLHIWHFTYDAVYPVRIIITDNSYPEPYQFNFAFMVSVDHNQPRRENLATTLFEGPERGDEKAFCNDVVNEITIFTVSDSTDQFDIANVNLTYTCGIFTCNIGQSDWISFGAAAGLTTNFPYCVNGILRGKKQGFDVAQMFIQAETPGFYTLHLKPIKEFTDYEIVKHDFNNPSSVKNLASDEKASITIRSTTDSFETRGIFPSEGDFPIKLLNDNHQYEVTIFLSKNNEITGGYKGIWDVDINQLTGSKIIFHVLENQGNQDNRFSFISDLNSHSNKIPKPELR